MTDNELIAEFMGIKVTNSMGLLWIVDEQDDIPDYKNGRVYSPSLDWSHLMQVVEKIETLYDTGVFYDGLRGPDVHNVRIYAKRGGSETIVIAYGKSKIETTYNAVVQFIKWYNSQK